MWPLILIGGAAAYAVYSWIANAEKKPKRRSSSSERGTVPRAFISFDFDYNANAKQLFAGQAKNPRTPFSIQDWSAKEAMPQREWEALVESRIAKCSMVIVLVGKRAHLAHGVCKEVAMAKKHGVPTLGVYVGGATETTQLPRGLRRNHVVAWEWDAVARAVRAARRRGRNRG